MPAVANVSRVKPARMRRTRRAVPSGTSRPCHQDPTAQATPDAVSGRPAAAARVVVLHAQRQRHDRLDTEQRAGQQPAQRDRRGHPGGDPHGAARQQTAQPPYAEGHRDHRGDGGQGGRVLAHLFEDGDARGDGEGLQDPPARRRAVHRRRRLRTGQRAQGRHQQRAAEDGERREPEEDPAPARVLGQQSGDQGPDQRGQHPRRGDGGEQRRAQLVGVGLADDDVRGGDQQAPAEALDDATGDEHRHRHRGSGEQQARDEGDEPGPQWQRGPTGIAQLPGHHHADDVGDEEAGEGPAESAQPMQVTRRRGQGGRDGHRLERDQRDDDEQPDTRPPHRRREDRARGGHPAIVRLEPARPHAGRRRRSTVARPPG